MKKKSRKSSKRKAKVNIKSKKWAPMYRAFCRKVVRQMQCSMYFHNYNIDIRYQKKEKEHGKEHEFKPVAADHCVTADISTDHRYYDARMNLYPNTHDIWLGGDKRKVAHIIVHELAHIITDPLYKIAVDAVTNSNGKYVEDVREQTTQQIANICMDLLEHDMPKLFK